MGISLLASAQTSTFLRLALIVLIAGVLLTPLALRVRQRAFDPFEPIILFAVVYGTMFVVRPGAMLISGDLVHEGPSTRLDIDATYTKMLVLALLGALGFVGGYLSSAGMRLAGLAPILRGPRDIRLAGLIAFLLGSAGIGAFAIVVLAGGPDGMSLLLQGRSAELQQVLGGPSFYPWTASIVVVPSAIAIAAVAWARGSWGLGLLALVLAAAVLLRALPTGNRLLLLPFFGALFVLYFLQRRSRPGLGTLIAIAAVAIVASAALSDLRGRSDRDESAVTSVRNVLTDPGRAVAPFTTGPDTEMAATLAAALKVIPAKQPHSFGATTLGDLVTRPIPRTLWENKPRPPREQLIATIWPVEAERGTLNPEFSVLLYFFWDLSYPGVLLGLGLYGILASVLFRYFSLHGSLLPVQVFFALALWLIPPALRDNPVNTTINLAFALAPIPIIFWLAARLERRLINRRLHA